MINSDYSYKIKNFKIVTLFVIFITIPLVSSASETMSVPAEFIQNVVLPGSNDVISRPSVIYFDESFNEIYITDQGNNRILIFDSDCNFRFQFYGQRNFSSPLDIAVDSEGYIYVLGYSNNGNNIIKFDFDGLYLGPVVIKDDLGVEYSGFSNFALDADNNFYLYNDSNIEVIVANADGRVFNRFTILEDKKDRPRDEIVVSSLYIRDGFIYIPVSNYGVVNKYSLDGEYIRTIGFFGSVPGKMIFPISVQVDQNGMVMVLDKMRFCVVCYDKDGEFLGEFGGKGFRSGWFYHPSLLAADNAGNVYIGQIYENKIQKCSIPDFIKKKVSVDYRENTNNDSNNKEVSVLVDTE